MKKMLFAALPLFVISLGFSGTANADGCYICKGGSYVKFSDKDTQDKRKKAKACGCEISGTRSECSASNLKILCSVKYDKDSPYKLAMVTEKASQGSVLRCSE